MLKGEEIQEDQQVSITDAMDVLVRWFCLLFGDQFTPDDVLDGYPVDRLMHDIALALMAVQTQTTEVSLSYLASFGAGCTIFPSFIAVVWPCGTPSVLSGTNKIRGKKSS